MNMTEIPFEHQHKKNIFDKTVIMAIKNILMGFILFLICVLLKKNQTYTSNIKYGS